MALPMGFRNRDGHRMPTQLWDSPRRFGLPGIGRETFCVEVVGHAMPGTEISLLSSFDCLWQDEIPSSPLLNE
jgi:hypothetical protein